MSYSSIWSGDKHHPEKAAVFLKNGVYFHRYPVKPLPEGPVKGNFGELAKVKSIKWLIASAKISSLEEKYS